MQAKLSISLLPPHPLIDHQVHAAVELHYSLERDGFALDHIQMKAVMQRKHLTLHAWRHHSGLAFDLDGFILPDDEVADLEVERFLLPGIQFLAMGTVLVSVSATSPLFSTVVFCSGLRTDSGAIPAFKAVITPTASQ